MSLFNFGIYELHGGKRSQFKIDCDALWQNDWETIAKLAINQLPPFKVVFGIPRGGTKLAINFNNYTIPEADTILIVDDVLTTGGSMVKVRTDIIEETKGKYNIIGVVLFARGECPNWVIPIFTLNKKFRCL